MSGTSNVSTAEELAARPALAGTDPATSALLRCGVLAGPIYVVVGGIQMLVRDGYDITRHPLSLMSNGDLGWIQIANFVLTGLLVVACAVGMRRVLHPARASTWGPRLLGVHGIGLIAAGAFVADPNDGFPPGTPPGMAETVSWHGALHTVAAMVAFFSLIAACLVFARMYGALGHRGRATYAAGTAACYLAALVGLFSSTGQGWTVVAFSVAVALGWAWVSVTAGHLLSGQAIESANLPDR